MKKKIYPLSAFLLSFILFISCNSNPTQQKAIETTSQKTIAAKTPSTNNESISEMKDRKHTNKQLVGGDRDEHGCIASAGYQWSELLQDCIRPFEKGTRLHSSNEQQNQAAYIIFNNDSSKVELFLPKETNHPILNKTKTLDGEIIWTGEDEDLWTVRCIEKIWGIYLNNKIQYVKYV